MRVLLLVLGFVVHVHALTQTEYITRLAFVTKLDKVLAEKDTLTICELLNSHHKIKDFTEADYNLFTYYAIRICNNQILNATIKKSFHQQYPHGIWNNQLWADSMNNMATPAEKLILVKDFKLAYPEDATKEVPFILANLAPTMLRSAMVKLDLKTFYAGLPEIVHVLGHQYNLAEMFDDIARQSAEKDTLTTDALALSKRSLEIVDSLRNESIKKPDKIKYPTINDLNNTYSNYADTYGFLLLNTKEYDSAYHYLKLAASYHQFQNFEINERYFRAMAEVIEASEALKNLEDAIMNDEFTTSLHKVYLHVAKTANINNGKERLMDWLEKAKQKKYEVIKTKMINEAAPDFELVTLAGKPLSLEKLKGKTIVIDFWATWCSPCIASFPGMQKVVDAYKNDPHVEILFINGKQKESNKNELVKSFMEQQPYTFQVLVDLYDKTVNAFNVTNIPAKFIIDRNGKIRFKSTGYNGNTDKTFEEMQMMIDLTKES